MAVLTEAFPAGFAGIRLFPRVSSHVDGQILALPEGFPADLTGVRFLSRVDPVMFAHFEVAAEGFRTDGAFQRLFPRLGAAAEVLVPARSRVFIPDSFLILEPAARRGGQVKKGPDPVRIRLAGVRFLVIGRHQEAVDLLLH